MKILVTGGSGAFGSAFLAWAFNRPEVERVVCYSRGEHAQARLADFLGVNNRGDGSNVRFFIGDVRDYRRLMIAMRGITHVVHAAALKVVPAGEYNPTEFARTNVTGAGNVIEAAIHSGVEHVVALSSDKATSPVNLYGATKLCSEKMFAAANVYGGGDTKFSVVRYGNVSGSTGSVIPLWWKRARAGKPLPVTHEEMTRFWMTLPEAVSLVRWVMDNAHGGEVVIPRLPSYRVIDLAHAVWLQATGSGRPDIEMIGIREGEKLHESMISNDEAPWCWFSIGHQKYMLLQDANAPRHWDLVDATFSYRSDSQEPMAINDLRSGLAALGYYVTENDVR